MNKQPINRREFLNLSLLGGLGLFASIANFVSYYYVHPRFEVGDIGFVRIEKLPQKYQEPVLHDELPFRWQCWLTHAEDGIRALYVNCPHLNAPRYRWQVDRFICPMCGSQFTYEGYYITGPAQRSLDSFKMYGIDPITWEYILESNESNEAIPVKTNLSYFYAPGYKILGKPRT